ncbi:MAG: helix-turn-helix domain-containing protein [Herpetosiphonaceae bacterium]|nr:helix-turn-helix domain-containing protein [Herpetosiphonaceae bacterium]
MHDPVSFGRILKDLRRARDLTQEELARLVACAAITIKKIEADALRPSRQIVERLADVLAVAGEERIGFIQLARTSARNGHSAPTPLTLDPLTALTVTPDDTNLLRALLETSFPALRNPYKGLRPFTEADASDFFGRTILTEQLLARLAGESTVARFLAVVGPSGSGKSSVVRAGLVPAIRQGGLPGSEHWFVAELLPGDHPLDELEAALLRVAVNPPASLLEQLQADERGLLRAVNRVLPGNDNSELLLVIDQFEEIFTLVEDEATRLHFLNSLLVAVLAPRSRLRVIVTLRRFLRPTAVVSGPWRPRAAVY